MTKLLLLLKYFQLPINVIFVIFPSDFLQKYPRTLPGAEGDYDVVQYYVTSVSQYDFQKGRVIVFRKSFVLALVVKT